MQLDLRKLAHFVAAVEERSLTRAAGRLRLSQQALSMSIRALERELGVPLLERGRGGVELLPAGRSLYTDGVPLLAAATAAVARARRSDGSETELLRIGHTPAVTNTDVITLLAGVPLAQAATVTQVIQIEPGDLGDRLWDRTIDLGLTRAMSSSNGLTGQVVSRHRLRVAVRAGHRLAQRPTVTMGDLAAETLLVPAPADASPDTALLLALFRTAGIEPRYRVSSVRGTPPVTAVLGNDGVALVTDLPGPAVGGAVQVLELEPSTTVPLLAAWRRDTRSRPRDLLLDALRG
jgi:DNA-binding transcriptional LysR family regulator